MAVRRQAVELPVLKVYPDALRFRDSRKMLDNIDARIDGVVVSTPDLMHAVPNTLDWDLWLGRFSWWRVSDPASS